MKPLRTRLREAILQQLKPLPYRVLDHSLLPLSQEQLPALTVRLEKASALPDLTSVLASGVCIHTYEMPVVIEGLLQGSDDLQLALETMGRNVIQQLSEDWTLGGLCKTFYWDSGLEVVISREGEKPLGSMRLVATLVYRTATHAPEEPWN
jgi:hypothetical protein